MCCRACAACCGEGVWASDRLDVTVSSGPPTPRGCTRAAEHSAQPRAWCVSSTCRISSCAPILNPGMQSGRHAMQSRMHASMLCVVAG